MDTRQPTIEDDDEDETFLEQVVDDMVEFIGFWFGAMRFDHPDAESKEEKIMKPPKRKKGEKAKDKLKEAMKRNNQRPKDRKKRKQGVVPEKGTKTDAEKGQVPQIGVTPPPISGFVGQWNKGTISASCDIITWNDMLTSPIRVEGDKIYLDMLGDLFEGTLDGNHIMWADGDVWNIIARPLQPTPQPELRTSYAPAADKLREAGAADENEDEWFENDYFTMTDKPYFTFSWAIIVFSLWFLFHLQTQAGVAGAETIWPGKTRLQIVDVDTCANYTRDIWRWWTYQFSHANLPHVLTNCLMLLLFGTPLEGWHGTLKMFIMFQVGVFGGAMCFLVWDNHAQVVGMSGGCYALIGMHFGDLLMNFSDKKYRVTKVLMLIVLAVLDIIQAWVFASQSTSHSAHFGGFVAGFIICTLIGYNKDVQVWERYFMVAAVVVGIALMIFSLTWGFAEWPPQELQETPLVRWCWLRQVISRPHFGDDSAHCVRCDDWDCIAKWSTVGCPTACPRTISPAACHSELGGFAVSER